MRVVMPVLTLVPGAMGGSETYVKALVKGLQERDDVDLTVLVSCAGAGALGAESEYVVRSLTGGASTTARVASLAGGARADAGARALLRSADVVHYPFTVPVPLPARHVPWVVTLHDVQHRDLPEMFSRAERSYRRLAYDGAARRANRVITVSNFSRERIHTTLGIPTDRIDVAHLGVDLDRFRPSSAPREPFVFYPATAWPHKNHARLIDAMELVRQERPDLRLVLTGGRREALGRLPEWVEHRGVVSGEEIASLYRSASCLAFPSLYEGFGLPPLEAAASGCPVALAATGASSELGLEAPHTFDPLNIDDMARAVIRSLLTPPGPRDSEESGEDRTSWRNCVETHVKIMRNAARL